MSDGRTDITEIPKQFLCRRCTRSGGELIPDGRVSCAAAGEPVEPVLKKEYGRFELCPYRTEHLPPLPSNKLKLLAAYARRIVRRGDALVREKVQVAEDVIREDLKAAARHK